MKYNGWKKDNRGYSLIEVLVSVVLITVIAIPLLGYFSSAASFNSKAKAKQKATILAQSIVERCKDKSIEDIAKSFHTVTDFTSIFNIVPVNAIDNDSNRVEEVKANGSSIGTKGESGSYNTSTGAFTNSSDGVLYYAIRNIKNIGNNYDALITIDTNIDSGHDYYNTNINTPLYQIKSIQSPKNVVAVETTQEARAVNNMWDLNNAYCDEQNSAHLKDTTWTNLVPVTTTQIENALCRIMYIEVDPEGTDVNLVRAKVYYKYYCPGIAGCPTAEADSQEVNPPLYDENVSLNDLENVYLFFQRGKDVEKVVLDIDSNAAVKFKKKVNLYLIAQAADLSSDTVVSYDANLVTVGNSFDQIDKVYSNGSKVSKNGAGDDIKASGGYISSFTGIRLMKIKVDIYKAGKLNNADYLYTTLSTTKVN